MSYSQRPRNIDEKLYAMQKAQSMANTVIKNKQILAFSQETFNKLNSFIPVFEKEVDNVKQILNNQTESMWLMQKNLSLLRMYVSHFIRVFNFAIDRDVFNVSDRSHYGIDVNNQNLPYLKSEADVILWVKKLINGEKQRIEKGGTPMCNPSIEEINEVYKKYTKLDNENQEYGHEYSRGLGDIGILINEADELIGDIWDEVEFFYRKESMISTLKLCRAYGIVYVTESSEDENEEEILKNIDK